jgi:hypothetical protein
VRERLEALGLSGRQTEKGRRGATELRSPSPLLPFRYFTSTVPFMVAGWMVQ